MCKKRLCVDRCMGDVPTLIEMRTKHYQGPLSSVDKQWVLQTFKTSQIQEYVTQLLLVVQVEPLQLYDNHHLLLLHKVQILHNHQVLFVVVLNVVNCQQLLPRTKILRHLWDIRVLLHMGNITTKDMYLLSNTEPIIPHNIDHTQ